MSFATKLNHIVYADGKPADIMKQPQTDTGKFSLPGVLAVKRVNGVPTVFPKDSGEVKPEENLLRVGGMALIWDQQAPAMMYWLTVDGRSFRPLLRLCDLLDAIVV